MQNIHCSGAVLRLDLSDCGNDVGSGLCIKCKKKRIMKIFYLHEEIVVRILNRLNINILKQSNLHMFKYNSRNMSNNIISF